MTNYLDSRGDDELYRLALALDPHGGEPGQVHRLRGFTRNEMTAGRIDPGTQARIELLLDAMTEAALPRAGDRIIAPATEIPWNVLEFVDCEGDQWRRAFGDERLDTEDGEINDLGQEWDWISRYGRSTTEGVLFSYTPLTVTRVAVCPSNNPASNPVNSPESDATMASGEVAS